MERKQCTPNIAIIMDADTFRFAMPHHPCLLLLLMLQLYQVMIPESEQGIWSDHPNIVDDHAHDCDSIGPNVVEPDPNPHPPVIASERDQYNHHKDPFTSY